MSAKGQLIRAIMFPKLHDLKYSRDALLFIAVMGAIGVVFYIWSLVSMIGFGADNLDMFVKFLDIIAVAVPPALTCALSIATSVSVSRLSQMQVHPCIHRLILNGLTS